MIVILRKSLIGSSKKFQNAVKLLKLSKLYGCKKFSDDDTNLLFLKKHPTHFIFLPDSDAHYLMNNSFINTRKNRKIFKNGLQ